VIHNQGVSSHNHLEPGVLPMLLQYLNLYTYLAKYLHYKVTCLEPKNVGKHWFFYIFYVLTWVNIFWIKNLFCKQAEVDHCSKHDCTPLHLAALRGNRSCVESLVKYGANIEATTTVSSSSSSTSSSIIVKDILCDNNNNNNNNINNNNNNINKENDNKRMEIVCLDGLKVEPWKGDFFFNRESCSE